MAEMDLKPAATLSDEQIEKINEAIADSFDEAELTRALRYKWGIVLSKYVGTKGGFINTVAELTNWTERRKKTRELVALAYAERPDVPAFQELAEALGLPLLEVSQKYDLTKPLPAKPALEAMVAHYSRFVDYGRFLKRFRNLGDRVCRVETPFTLGTGFLVGPNRVLTNFHVVEGVAKAPSQASQIVCRFDYHQDEDPAAKKKAPKVSRLAEQWLVEKSPYSDSDNTGVGDAEADKLDYALLRLAENLGTTPGSDGKDRGWFSLTADRPIVAVRDFVVVPQHPEGDLLQVAWGAVLEFNGSGTRVRYDTRTEEGASGSPCLTVDLDIFGLHHATDPQKKPKFNQAIPLNLIADDLEKKKVALDAAAH